jgi:hypothetical protein
MKKLFNNNFKLALPALLLGTCFTANAQKLPNVQLASMRAPSSIKMDGKAAEWDYQFQAYNNATNVFYTLSNDDNNLYLTVRATDQSVINKILRGGITFTINAAGKKTDKGGAGITYPIFGTDRPRVALKAPEIIPGDAISIKRADSFMYANNALLDAKSKNIITKGIPGVDSVISVYNEDGIKAVEAFDNKMVYTCEFAVSLKHFGLSVDNATKFAYNFKLNGVNIDDIMKNVTITQGANGEITSISVNKTGAAPVSGGGGGTFTVTGSSGGAAPRMDMSVAGGAPIVVSGRGSGLQVLTSPTDFWGEYTLAKK